MNKYIVMLDKTNEPWEDYSVPIDIVECEVHEIEVLIQQKQLEHPNWFYMYNKVYENYEDEEF